MRLERAVRLIVAIGDHDIGRAGRLEHPGNALVLEGVIARDQRDCAEFRALQGGLEPCADALPLGVMHHHDTRLLGRETVHDSAGVVGAAVVDQDDFKIVEHRAPTAKRLRWSRRSFPAR
jgi:hypothetical protein